MGGFAGTHHDTVLALEQAGECRLVCTCDPALEQFTERGQNLRLTERGVRLFTDYREMLRACREELDVVTIPTPVPLHAEMHRAVVAHGLAVYLEKPPTLNAAELAAMLAVEARAVKLTNVGFNYIVDPLRQRMKQRLVAGEFGAVRRVGVRVMWPRPTSYYQRANWPGRLRLNGQLVLDSCIGNAMAHHVHDGLFWGGAARQWQWGDVREVTAELYRAHAIEGTDTVFLRATLAAGPVVDIVMSHACAPRENHYAEETIECEQATLAYHAYPPGPALPQCAITWNDGRTEEALPANINYNHENFRAYFAYLRGETERPITRLIDSQPFVHLNSQAYLAAGRIVPVPAATIQRTPTADGQAEYVAITDIDAIAEHFALQGTFPSAQGIHWARPGGTASVTDLPRLEQVIDGMIAEGTTTTPAPAETPHRAAH